jgi:uncharacterized membrane protein
MTGPVQLLVVGFDDPSFSGEIMVELARLREAGVVRLVDVLLVRRDEDGSFDTLPAPPGSDPASGELAANILGAADEPDPDDATWSLADSVEPGGTAAVVLLEHLWAKPLVDAIGAAGGRPLGEGWLSSEDRARIPD